MKNSDSGEKPSGRPEYVVRLQADVYGIDAIKKAAYRLSDRVVCEIATEASEIICTLRPVLSQTEVAIAQLADQFRLEVLDQDLRRSIAAETEPIRNAILAYALSRADIPRE